MSQVRMMYYPQAVVYQTTTKNGLIELSTPDIYENPLSNKVIAKVDLVNNLQNKVGSNCVLNRNLLYNLIAGNYTQETSRYCVASMYRRHSDFANYVHAIYALCDHSRSLADVIIEDLLSDINDTASQVIDTLSSHGGRFLTMTHGNIYFAFDVKPDLDNVKGIVYIC